MTIFETLKNEHEAVKEMIGSIKKTEAGNGREQLFTKLKNDLEIHTRFENTVFYPAVAENAEAKQTIGDAIEEHEEAEALLEELDTDDKLSEEWMEQLEELEEMLLHHIEEEEGEVFEFARGSIDDERARNMAEQYEQEKKQETRRSA